MAEPLRERIRRAIRRVDAWAVAVALLTVAGAALRLFHIGRPSLWYDEAYSVHLASMSLSEATAWTARDVVPPLYYYVLHFWQGLFGTSEVAVRSFSALAGTLTIPVAYKVGKTLFGRLAGLLTAVLVALSPLYIWYSQEARMYAMLTFLGLVSGWFLLRVLMSGQDRERRYAWVGFLLASVATSYTHTAGLFLLAFYAVAFVVGWLAAYRGRWVVFAEGALVLAAFVAAHVPWVPLALRNLGLNRGYWEGVLGVRGVLYDVFLSYWAGKTILPDVAARLFPGFVAIVVVASFGLVVDCAAKRQRAAGAQIPQWFAVLFVVLYSVFPVLLYLVLFYRVPKFDTRYLYMASPGLFLFVGAGLAGLLRGRRPRWRLFSQSLGILAAACLIGVFAYGDYNNYYDPRFQKDDFRGVAHYIAEHIGPNETVILCSGHFFPVFEYYFGPDNWHPLPDEPILNTENILTYQVAYDLRQILAGKDGVWGVFWQSEVADPNGFLTMMLDEAGYRLPYGPQFWGVRYIHWGLDEDAAFEPRPQIQYAQSLNFDNKIQFLGFSIDKSDNLFLYWQALQALDRNYAISLRLLSQDGEFWGALDRRPAGYYFPTSRWRPLEPLFGSNPIPALSGTPPGDYTLELVVYDEETVTPLNVLDEAGAPAGRTARIGPVTLRDVQPVTEQDPLPPGTPVRFGDDLEILAWQVSGPEVYPGDTVSVVGYWQALRDLDADYQVDLRIVGEGQDAVASEEVLLGTPDYRTSRWVPGRIVRSVLRLRIPATVSEGQYALRLAVRDAQGNIVGTETVLRSLNIKSYEHRFTVPEFEYAIGANMGNLAELVGADVEPTELKPGDQLDVTLYWLAKAEFAKSYTVFVHVLDEQGQIWAQRDIPPQDGKRPTTSWIPGEVIAGTHVLTIPENTPPGEYLVEVGLYDASSPGFERIPVLDSQGEPAGDRVILARIGVK